jgi:hypothetical protein
METVMLAIVSMVRRRLRHEFLRIKGRYRNMYLPVYACKRPGVQGEADQDPISGDELPFSSVNAANTPVGRFGFGCGRSTRLTQRVNVEPDLALCGDMQPADAPDNQQIVDSEELHPDYTGLVQPKERWVQRNIPRPGGPFGRRNHSHNGVA